MKPERIAENILAWIPEGEIDDNTRIQTKNIAQLPFIYKHVALMPDCHFGLGASVGSCVPTRGAIIPSCVGVDVGCGMKAVRTSLKRSDLPEDLSVVREAIEGQVPLSAGKYNHAVKKTAVPRVAELEALATASMRYEFYEKTSRNWRNQLGSLGSGNHFIEITVDENDDVWAFLHSGSRGIGNKLAQHHIKIAKDLMKKWFIELVDPGLAYLVQGTQEFTDYLTDLKWAQRFASLNRDEMMDRVLGTMRHHLGEFDTPETIACHHNFTQWENHMGDNILVSRKGAIEARVGQLGLIPGSMGTSSYVVSGLGNVASFNTAPHGAGRRMSRGQARKTFTMADFDKDMEGIEANRSEAFLDELPGAYKDIDAVIEWASDLVEVVHTFKQVVNVKGD